MCPLPQSPSATVARPNMALSKKAADTLQQKLQQIHTGPELEAQSSGAGLGFSTAPARVFYIDRNASKSIKVSKIKLAVLCPTTPNVAFYCSIRQMKAIGQLS